MRLGFTPLLPTFPCFGAITISLMGRPFVDFSLKIVAGDLMATPGLDLAVGRLIRELVDLLVWPQRIVVPLFEDNDYSRLIARPAGLLLVNAVRARGLPAADLPTGSIAPHLKMRISGQQQAVETSQKRRAAPRPAPPPMRPPP